MSSSQNDPIVTVVMANYNGEKFLGDALDSARRQTLAQLEIVVVDDRSGDSSLQIAETHASADSRIKVISLPKNSGPGAARNAGLAAASGRWVAIFDSDDRMHPSRLEELVKEAEASGADICADDLMIFGEGVTPHTLLSKRQRQLRWTGAAEYIASNTLLTREPPLGYLKPLIRTSFLRRHNLAYRPELKIGEDYELMVEALARGAKFRLCDTLGYFYRKHHHSISHRITASELGQLVVADERLMTLFEPQDKEVRRAFRIRRASIERSTAYTSMIDALKTGKWLTAIASAVRSPRAIPLLAMPIAARLRRLLGPRRDSHHSHDRNDVCLISRQRLVGPTNGSSAYLLALCRALRDDGHRITLISPSTAAFGRWPVLIFRPEMDVFDQLRIRGSWSFGKRIRIAKDPRIWLAAGMAVLSRLASKAGVQIKSWDQAAPYSVAVPWKRDDQLFIARNTPSSSALILLDYAFSVPAFPYALVPSAKSAVIMHDFFSARAERFKDLKLSDSVAALSEQAEIDLLRQTDSVVAIQQAEATEIKKRLPAQHVIVTPIAVDVSPAPQPGDSRSILFVGSNTAPNVIGLRWFLAESWPLILRAVPDCRLDVAGSVGDKFADTFPSVRFLGLVRELNAHYSGAGVVISPLTVGSGLKIKVIEALGRGKAIVATTVSVEGCSDDVQEAVAITDEAERFARAVVELLQDDKLRLARACKALEFAKREYSSEVCYRDFLNLAKSADIEASSVH